MAINVFSVPEISCDHCVAAITKEVSPLADVTSVDVNIADKTVSVDGGAAEEILTAIDEAGYDATLV